MRHFLAPVDAERFDDVSNVILYVRFPTLLFWLILGCASRTWNRLDSGFLGSSMISTASGGRRNIRLTIDPDDEAGTTPQFDVVAVDETRRFFDRVGIIGANQRLIGENTPVMSDSICPVFCHSCPSHHRCS